MLRGKDVRFGHLPEDVREGDLAGRGVPAVEALGSPPHVAADVEVQVTALLRRQAHLRRTRSAAFMVRVFHWHVKRQRLRCMHRGCSRMGKAKSRDVRSFAGYLVAIILLSTK